MKTALAAAIAGLLVFAGMCDDDGDVYRPDDATWVAEEWARRDPDTLGQLVVETALASPDPDERVPALLAANFGGLLEAAVVDELGNGLAVGVEQVAYHGDNDYTVTLMVAGTVSVKFWPVESVDLAVPVILRIDLHMKGVYEWRADPETATFAVH